MIGLAMLAVACSLVPVSSDGPQLPNDSQAARNLQAGPVRGLAMYDAPSLESLIEGSDLVVKGVPIGRKGVKREPATSSDYPARLAAIDRGKVIPYDDVDFAVETYYKGSGPATIRVVADLVSTGGLDMSSEDLQDGREYVLFLFLSNVDYWGGAYILTRQRGAIWAVKGNTAANEWEDFGRSLDLTILDCSPPTRSGSSP